MMEVILLLTVIVYFLFHRITAIALLILLYCTIGIQTTYQFFITNPFVAFIFMFCLHFVTFWFWSKFFNDWASGSSQPIKPINQPQHEHNNSSSFNWQNHLAKVRKANEAEAKRIDDYRRITGQR